MTKDELKDLVDKGLVASKNALKKGAEVSKSALDKAGKAAVKFGDESVLRIEIKQLEAQIKKDTAELGTLAVKLFLDENRDTVSKDEDDVSAVLNRILQARRDISEREGELKLS